MLDRLVNGVDRGIRALSEAFAGPVHSYCRLETVDNGVLVADDGSLVSLLHLEGSLKHVGVEEYTAIVSGLTEKLQATLSKPGHAIQTLFEYDPENSGERIAELLQPSRLTAHNLGLHIGRCAGRLPAGGFAGVSASGGLGPCPATLLRSGKVLDCSLDTARRAARQPAENRSERTRCGHVHHAHTRGLPADCSCRRRLA